MRANICVIGEHMRKHIGSYIAAAVLACLCVCLCFAMAGCGGDADGYEWTDAGLKLAANADGWTVVGGDERAEAVVIPDTYGGLPVTEIADRAFAGLAVRELTIGANVSVVGDEAFADCVRLGGITIPSGIKFGLAPFKNCAMIERAALPVAAAGLITKKNLRDVTITDGQTLPAYAFADCASLARVVLPDGMEAVGTDAFRNCPLADVSLPASLTYVGRGAFYGCGGSAEVRFRGGLEAWCGISFGDVCANPLGCADKAYFADTLLTALELPVTVTALKSCAFGGYRALESVTFHDGVTDVGASAFYGCSALTRVEMPDSLTAIGASAFAYTGLETLSLPAGVNYIGMAAFACCPGLGSIAVAAGNTAYRAENDCLFDIATNALVLGCKNSVIPSSVTEIGAYAFAGCTASRLSLPSGLNTIGAYAFYNCQNITRCTVPGGVTDIGRSAFGNCDSLINLTFEVADGWYRLQSPGAENGYAINGLSDMFKAARFATDSYANYYWTRV